MSFPNYQDKSKLLDDIGGFFVRRINRLRSDIDAIDIDLSMRKALPPNREVDAAHVFHSFQPLSENAVFALIRKSALPEIRVTLRHEYRTSMQLNLKNGFPML